MNSEDTCIYSFGFATISSAIPAFSARGDLLIVYWKKKFNIKKIINFLKWFRC